MLVVFPKAREARISTPCAKDWNCPAYMEIMTLYGMFTYSPDESALRYAGAFKQRKARLLGGRASYEGS